jgi:hypothetical protein
MPRLTLGCFFALFTFTFAPAARCADDLVVHEWGTFTSLQDESGKAVGGVNVDDEPVPRFVHTLRWDLVVNGRATNLTLEPLLMQGVPQLHPDVTMRLETPVLYFHLPKGAAPITADVSVTFNGGWLSQYYPAARVAIDGQEAGSGGFKVTHITPSTKGTLAWTGLVVGGAAAGPKTTEHVWLAPRAVGSAANVTSSLGENPESEKYLFYRGVGHLDSPLRVVRRGDELRVEYNYVDQDGLMPSIDGPIWLVHVRKDGRCAFRKVAAAGGGKSVPANFAESEYDPNTNRLRGAMHAALVSDGLFADEAKAMLDTWELSYFKSAGTRLFFIVPRAWTERLLPLTVRAQGIALPKERVVRAMVGRIELITPEHRELMKIVAHPPGNPSDKTARQTQLDAYRDLGRFRDALVVGENRRQSTKALESLMSGHQIEEFSPD